MRYRKSCVTGAGLEALQVSATRDSSRTSMELVASLASFGTGSGVLAVAICTGGDWGGSTCGELGNAAHMIDSGSSETAVVSLAVPVTDSTAIATSALATSTLTTAALLIAMVCGAFANSTSAAREAARRSSIGTAPVCSMPAEPKPASQAITQPARTTVPHAAAPVANRRGFIIPSPPKAPPEPCCTAKHATG